MALRTSNWERRLTHQSFAGGALAAGPITAAAYNTLLEAGKVWLMGDVGGFGRKDRGLRAQVLSDGANNTALSMIAWAVDRVDDADATSPDSYQLWKIGTFTATLSTKMGVSGSGGPSPSTLRYADTIAWSASGDGTNRKTITGGQMAAFSPADDTPARLALGDVDNAMGIIFEVTSDPGTDKTVYVLCKSDT